MKSVITIMMLFSIAVIAEEIDVSVEKDTDQTAPLETSTPSNLYPADTEAPPTETTAPQPINNQFDAYNTGYQYPYPLYQYLQQFPQYSQYPQYPQTQQFGQYPQQYQYQQSPEYQQQLYDQYQQQMYQQYLQFLHYQQQYPHIIKQFYPNLSDHYANFPPSPNPSPLPDVKA